MQFRVSHLQGLPSESVTAGAMITDQVTGLRITSRLARSRLDHGESDRENNGDSPPGACADHNRDCETARPAPTPLTAQAAEEGTGGARPPPGSRVRVPVPGSPSREPGPSSLAPSFLIIKFKTWVRVTVAGPGTVPSTGTSVSPGLI